MSNIMLMVLGLKSFNWASLYFVSYSHLLDYVTPLPLAVFLILRINNHSNVVFLDLLTLTAVALIPQSHQCLNLHRYIKSYVQKTVFVPFSRKGHIFSVPFSLICLLYNENKVDNI